MVIQEFPFALLCLFLESDCGNTVFAWLCFAPKRITSARFTHRMMFRFFDHSSYFVSLQQTHDCKNLAILPHLFLCLLPSQLVF